MADSGSDIHRLIHAAQSTLADVEQRGLGAQVLRISFAGVQAVCAGALAIKELADAVRALVVTEEKP